MYPLPFSAEELRYSNGDEKMRELDACEISHIGGALKPVDNAESEVGKTINDVMQLCDKIGSWLGGKIYDWTH
ncbi:hypothetical protein H9L17_08910 [Thermomonas brevis]|uniref:Uncharacterized protein n=1 Tax=Thermomonas brevis TaxID=215691 RepID=A0A7G9QPS8_9GAMM|nr:hypothetical protein [Thermomonas brevis]QNN45353.1 hypothetical protein H9L17_08910 [Thermomonas brevis]